jgi:outer membrane protein OmpA-like peptidoglycan-associated protein
MTASATGYESNTVSITVPGFLSYNEYRKTIGLAPIAAQKPETEVDTIAAADDVNISYFEFDKYEVLPEYRESLKDLYETEILPILNTGAVITITLDAHTDDRGTEEYNFGLSRRRGAAVSKYLRDLGVPLEAIKINAHGERNPARTERTEEAHSRNRRVELRIGVSGR